MGYKKLFKNNWLPVLLNDKEVDTGTGTGKLRFRAFIQEMIDTDPIGGMREVSCLSRVLQHTHYHPEGNVLNHTLQVIDQAEHIANRENLKGERRIVLLMSSLLHDVGKAVDGVTVQTKDREWVSPGHAEAGVIPALQFMIWHMGSNELIDDVVTLIRLHMQHTQFWDTPPTKKAVRRLMRTGVDMDMLRMLAEADHNGRDKDDIFKPSPLGMPQGMRNVWEVYLEVLDDQESKVEPVITGQFIISKGVSPSINKHKIDMGGYEVVPFAHILDVAMSAQLDGDLYAENADQWWEDAIKYDKFGFDVFSTNES